MVRTCSHQGFCSRLTLVITGLWLVIRRFTPIHMFSVLNVSCLANLRTHESSCLVSDAGKKPPLSIIVSHLISCRACAGRHFGEASVWLAIANVTAIFSVTKDTDDSGQQITPPAEFAGGFVRYIFRSSILFLSQNPCSAPKPFECRIRPRSQKAIELVESARASVGI
jgi:hypothetical protein